MGEPRSELEAVMSRTAIAFACLVRTLNETDPIFQERPLDPPRAGCELPILPLAYGVRDLCPGSPASVDFRLPPQNPDRSAPSAAPSRLGHDPSARPLIRFDGRHQAIWRCGRGRRPVARYLPGRVLLSPRSFRLWEDHPDAGARGVRGAEFRACHARRAGPARRAALSPAREHDVPVLRAVSAHERRAQHRVRLAAGRAAEA